MRRVATLSLVILLGATSLFPCSDGGEYKFVLTLRPDAPIGSYVAGNLGIVQPTYARSYLVVAYRYFSGKPLDSREVEAAVSLITKRLERRGNDDGVAVDKWLEARGRVAGLQPPGRIEPWAGSFYEGYLNCPSDAFNNAVRTLDDRIAQFGTSSTEVLEWARAQDSVFANCSGSAIVEPPNATLPPLMRADREYQIAAAAFYRGQYDDAHDRFMRIAADASSPWRKIAPYLAARALVRKATLSAEQGFSEEPMRAADKEVAAILNDPSRSEIHTKASQLRGFIAFKLHPEERTIELARALGTKITEQDLSDYTDLIGRANYSDEMTDWIVSFHVDRDAGGGRASAGAKAHAMTRWRETQSVPWLVAAISQAEAADAAARELIAAAHQLPVDSPAWFTAAYHSARLLSGLGDADGAHELLDSALKRSPSISTANALRTMRLPLSRNLGDFSADGFQRLAGDDRYVEDPPLLTDAGFTQAAARIINTEMPLAALVSLSESAGDAKAATRLRIAAWTRAVLLHRHEVAVKVARRLTTGDTALDAAFKRYVRANDKDVEALWVIVNFPALRPYVDSATGFNVRFDTTPMAELEHGSGNWWCIDGHSKYEDVDPGTGTPLFLKSIAREAAAERARMAEVGSGSTYILSGAIALAREHPANPFAPEALSRAIQGTRWTCGDDRSRQLAETAWKLLHSRYRNTAWARRTKYWYVASYQ